MPAFARLRAALCLGVCLALAAPAIALAQSVSFIAGTVTAGGAPAAGAEVTLEGNNLTLRQTTSATGTFSFTGLGVGQYTVTIRKANMRGIATINLTSGGSRVTIPLVTLQTIGQTKVSAAPPPTKGSGTDVILNHEELSRLPATEDMPQILLTLPTASRGSNGQIHINGDHNGINYIIDGLELPENLNRVLGNQIDPSNIAFINAVQGAFPAQYGDKFATVLDIGMQAPRGPAAVALQFQGGSYNTYDQITDFHTPVGQGGALVLSARFSQDGFGINPPVLDAPHNASSATNQFLRLSLPVGPRDYINFDAITGQQTFAIPPDLAHNVPASTDDNEYQSDNYFALQFRHAINDNASLSFGPSYQKSKILDTNDLANDLAGAAGSTCTDFSNCQYYSVYADRSSYDYRFNIAYANHAGAHDLRIGGLIGTDVVPKDYAITLQPGNQLNPSGGTFTAYDTNTNNALTGQLYAQDSWTLSKLWELDYGLRYDAYAPASSDFSSFFDQFSPRVKLTRNFGKRASAYVYYGRLFVPFSLESIDPRTAASLYVPGTYPDVAYDLKPQRDSLYEAGFHVPLGYGDLGFRISHKASTDWIDDTQVGDTNLHQDINFPVGSVNVQSLYYSAPMRYRGTVYGSLSHVVALNSLNCETQLLQNCALAGPPGGPLVQADHDQHWTVNAGTVINDAHGGWYSVSLEYGSGLSQDPTLCSPVDYINCKVPPHTTMDVAKAVPVGKRSSLVFTVTNIFNDQYAITLDNSLQGTHYARPRSFYVKYNIGNP